MFSEVVGFRKMKVPPRERVLEFPNGETLQQQLRELDRLPATGKDAIPSDLGDSFWEGLFASQ